MTNFDTPQIFTIRTEDIKISGQVLVDLMQAILARDVPFRFMARGWSMTPFIRDGDIITVESTKDRKLGIGKVVAFNHPDSGKLVVHRIVAWQGNLALIAGDSNPNHPDGPIPPNNLIGHVTRIERDHKRIWLGLGPERFVIAWLSRMELLIPLRTKVSSWRTRFSIKDR